MTVLFRCWLLAVLSLSMPGWAAISTQELGIAAAADLVYCLPELNAAFKKSHPGVQIKMTTGSSGNFFAQIKSGAPFDLFMSADMRYPRELVDAGLAVPESLTPYAIGRIVLWTMKPSLDIDGGLAGLPFDQIGKLAIANPEHAPYGRAARSALQSAGRWEEMESKLVFGENIAQTAQFVLTGNADVAVLALSLARAPQLSKIGRYVEIPADQHPALEQGAVITRHGRNNPNAALYVAFLRAAAARAVFNRYGFLLPTPEVRSP